MKPAGVILVVIMFVGISVAIALSRTFRTPTILSLSDKHYCWFGGWSSGGFGQAIAVRCWCMAWFRPRLLVYCLLLIIRWVLQVIAFAAGSFLTTVLLNLALQSMEDSLAQTRANEQAVVHEEFASTLELRVEERTRQLADASKIAQLSDWEYDVLRNQFTFNDAFMS